MSLELALRAFGPILLLATSAFLAVNGMDGWGWFLALGFLLCTI